MKWEKKKLAEVASFRLGKMLDEKKNKGVMLPYLANVNVRWGQFDIESLREMRFEDHELERYCLKYGDIVMCEGGEPGRCAIWKDEIPTIFYQKALHRIRPNLELLNAFLYYQFLFLGKTGAFEPLFTGATIKHLPREQLAKVEVSVPPLPTQRRIASILSAYDDLIENNLRRIKLLEEAAQHIYREWFVRMRFPGWEGVKFGAEGLPEGWKNGKIEDLMVLQRGFDLPTHQRIEGSYPIITSTGIAGYHSEFKVNAPGVVTGRSGTIGKVIFIDEPFWPLNTALWVKEFKSCGAQFAYFFLKDLKLENFSGGAAVPSLDRNVVHSQPCTIPSENLNRLFEVTVSPFFEKISVLKKYNAYLKEARDILLPRLMNRTIEV